MAWLIAGAAWLPTALVGAPPDTAHRAANGIADQSENAGARLTRAIATSKAIAMPAPVASAMTIDPEQRRRALDALRRRAGDVAMAKRAATARETGDEGLARESQAMSRRLGPALGLQSPDIVAIAKVAAPTARLGWVPLLFASSSMPLDELRSYAVQLERTGGALAFRGMPGGLHRVGPMAKLSAEILRVDPGCEGPACVMRKVAVVIDPIAFRQHGVTRVPALAMVPGDPTQAYCERSPDQPVGQVAYGDAALSGLLEELARMGEREEVRDAQSRLAGR